MQVICYHKNCQDGLFSALNFWNRYGEKDTIYIPVSYSLFKEKDNAEILRNIFNKQSAIDPKTTDLILVDFSFPVDFLLYCQSIFKSILILDHHKTAIDSYIEYFKEFKTIENNWIQLQPFENVNIIFSEKESGAKLSYMYLNPDQEVPDYIQLVSDRDLWTFQLKNTKAFFFGCEMLSIIDITDFNILSQLIKTDIDNILHLGRSYEKCLNNKIEKVCDSNMFMINIFINKEHFIGYIINSNLDIASDLGDYILKNNNIDIVIIYNIEKNNNVQFSVRSISSVDSSKISLAYNGGGHKNASGFYGDLNLLQKFLTKGINI